MGIFRKKVFIFIALELFIYMISFDYQIYAQDSEFSYNSKKSIIKINGIGLKTGDAIAIEVSADTTSFLNGVYVIDDVGNISLPVLGKVNLNQYDEIKLKNYLVDNFKNQLIYQYIDIEPRIRIGLLGGFTRPGFYYVNPKITFWELMRISGGPLERKLFKKSVLRRGEQKIKLDIIEEIKDANNLIELGIKSGDVIEIPNPTERGTWDKIVTILPLISTMATFVSVYVSYQLIRTR